MSKMRAKMEVINIEKAAEGCSERLTFRAVCRTSGYSDSAGLDEDNTYAHYSPQADLTITVANPDLFGQFERGQKYYVDFTQASV
jgi:hypothetical protein